MSGRGNKNKTHISLSFMLHCDPRCHPVHCPAVCHSLCPFVDCANVVCRPSAHCFKAKCDIPPPVKPSLAPPETKAAVLPPLHMPGLPVRIRALMMHNYGLRPLSLPPLPGISTSRPTQFLPIEVPQGGGGGFPTILPRSLFPGPEYTSAFSFITPSYPLGPPHSSGKFLTIVKGSNGGLSVVGGNGAFVYPSSMVWDGPLAPHIVASRPATHAEYGYPGRSSRPTTVIASNYGYDPSSLPPAGKALHRGMLPSYLYHSDIPPPTTVPRARGSSYGLF